MISIIGTASSSSFASALATCMPGSDALSFQDLLDGDGQPMEMQAFSTMGMFGLARAVNGVDGGLIENALPPVAFEDVAALQQSLGSNAHVQHHLIAALLAPFLADESAQPMTQAVHPAGRQGDPMVKVATAQPLSLAAGATDGEAHQPEAPIRSGGALGKALLTPEARYDAAFHLSIHDGRASLSLRLDQSLAKSDQDRLRDEVETLLNAHRLSLASFKISGVDQFQFTRATGPMIWPSQA